MADANIEQFREKAPRLATAHDRLTVAARPQDLKPDDLRAINEAYGDTQQFGRLDRNLRRASLQSFKVQLERMRLAMPAAGTPGHAEADVNMRTADLLVQALERTDGENSYRGEGVADSAMGVLGKIDNAAQSGLNTLNSSTTARWLTIGGASLLMYKLWSYTRAGAVGMYNMARTPDRFVRSRISRWRNPPSDLVRDFEKQEGRRATPSELATLEKARTATRNTPTLAA